MNAKTLNDYLTSAHVTVMLCRAHADDFALSVEDISDVEWRIEMHITELETLRGDIQSRNVVTKRPNNVVPLAAFR